MPVVADLSDGDDRARIVPEVEAALGTVDILVNNAAAAFYLPTPEITLKRRRIMYELNVHAPIDLAQGVIPGMRAKGRGWIVNVSSATSKHPSGPPFSKGQSVGAVAATYGSSKAALERYTTGLASELYGDAHRGELGGARRRGAHPRRRRARAPTSWRRTRGSWSRWR